MAVDKIIAVASSFNVQSVIVFLVVLLLTIVWIRRPKNLPPGPRPLPIIGNARGLVKGKLHIAFDGWAKQYGSVMSVWLGSRLVIVLNDINAVKEALGKQADCFSDRIQFHSGGVVPAIQKGSIILSNGDVCKERRRFGLSAMRNLGMGKRSVEHKINEEARHLIESFDGEGEKPFDPEHTILNAVSNIICRISFGYRFEYSDLKFAHLIKLFKANLSSSALPGFSGPFKFNRKLEENLKWVKKIEEFIQGIVQIKAGGGTGLVGKEFQREIVPRKAGRLYLTEKIKGTEMEHRESFDPNDIRDVIDMYIQEIKQQEEQGKMGNEDTAFHKSTMWRGIFDLFVAGTHTTTTTLMWLMLYMAIHPDVQKKVQKEIDDVIGSDRQPTSEDRINLPYTNAVLMEMQRHRPVTPHAMPHQTHYETKLFGYTIPANTIVFVNLWSIMHDPKCWNDPEEFNPQRFLSKDGKTVEKPEAFIPFSFGRRICIGETLAKMELFIYFVNIFQRFQFSLPVGKPLPSLDGIAGTTLGPHPYEIVAKNR